MDAKYYFETIKNDLAIGKDRYDIARKIFTSFPDYTAIKYDQHSVEFEIKNEVSNHFHIPFHSIQLCGSAKTGKSLYKHHDFDKTKSDFDLAIISPELYTKYFEVAFKQTQAFKDATTFPRKKKWNKELQRHINVNVKDEFLSYLNIGYFRPDLMPKSKDRTEWFSFFNHLSEKYIQYFSNINAGIYLSQ
ncbi:TPA: hypothetical protein JH909_002540, partial [Acinetobacter baumannii]|nr:hypothetical protein [Acinetobacter baumannii]